jgi:hypothetical protein
MAYRWDFVRQLKQEMAVMIELRHSGVLDLWTDKAFALVLASGSRERNLVRRCVCCKGVSTAHEAMELGGIQI